MAGKKARIGWIGLGKMGTPICQRLRTAGYPLAAFVRNEAGRAKAEALGCDHFDNFVELTDKSDIIISSISDDTALDSIMSGPTGLGALMKTDQVFVETSTVSPSASERASEFLKRDNVAYIRAPLSGSTAMAETGQLTVVASGPQATFKELVPLFEVFSTKQYHVGDDEQARYLKLALNAMVGATSALVAEVLAFGQKGGLDAASMLEVICNSAVASPLLNYKRPMLEKGDFTPAFATAQMMKDLDIVLSVGQSKHVPLPMVAQIRQLYEIAFANGCGEQDFFVLTDVFRRMADTSDSPAR